MKNKNLYIIIGILIIIVFGMSIYIAYHKGKDDTNKNQNTEIVNNNKNNIIKDNDTNNEEEINKNTVNDKIENNDNNITSDEEVIDYFYNVNNDINSYDSNDNTAKEKITNTFKTLTDFIFYGETIKGKTFSELLDSSKVKIIEIYENVDSKIETKYPNYKENIKEKGKNTYNNIKEKVIILKDKLITEDVKDSFEEDKENTKGVFSTLKDYVSSWFSKDSD